MQVVLEGSIRSLSTFVILANGEGAVSALYSDLPSPAHPCNVHSHRFLKRHFEQVEDKVACILEINML